MRQRADAQHSLNEKKENREERKTKRKDSEAGEEAGREAEYDGTVIQPIARCHLAMNPTLATH